MNEKTKNGLIVVGVILVGLFLTYKFIIPNSSKVVLNYLNATFGNKKEHEDFVKSAEKGYLNAWSKAIMEGRNTFTYKDKEYNTSGGTSVK